MSDWTDGRTEERTRGGLPRKPLVAWRKARGLSQMKLAAAIGVTLATIANIEQARNEPSLSTAQKVADALDLDLDQIVWPLAHAATPYPSKAKRSQRARKASGAHVEALHRGPEYGTTRALSHRSEDLGQGEKH
ncbi:MAG TPA: helix-turn-helix transcriptional regulator [Ktedonobacterales bacterium]|jgi:transcriptional regulator with XRE-family HTH domain